MGLPFLFLPSTPFASTFRAPTSSACNSFVAILLHVKAESMPSVTRVDSATANWYNLLNFLLFSDQLHSGYFTTKSALFEVGTETVNCLLCSTLGRSFRLSR